MSYRIEQDTMGEVQVPADKYWGAQTERSRNNFKIGPEASMPKEIIEAFAYLKKAAAYTNADCGILSAEKRDLIANFKSVIITILFQLVEIAKIILIHNKVIFLTIPNLYQVCKTFYS